MRQTFILKIINRLKKDSRIYKLSCNSVNLTIYFIYMSHPFSFLANSIFQCVFIIKSYFVYLQKSVKIRYIDAKIKREAINEICDCFSR